MKRMTALLLAVIMVVGMIPTTALATADAPRGVQWSQGGMPYLTGTWNPPVGDSHEGYDYDLAVYYSPDGVAGWKSLGYHYVTTYSFSPGAMTVDPSYIAVYGDGFYKFAVACSSLSVNGESEWVESDIYHLDSTQVKERIAAPVSGSYDAATETLTWTDPDGIDPGIDEHRAIIEVYYTGEDGVLPMGEWELVKRESIGTENSAELSDLLSDKELAEMKQGKYVFMVSNLAEDYLMRGISPSVQLSGAFDHVVEDDGEDVPVENALPTPSGLAWTENGITWDNPYDMGYDIDNYGAYSIQLLRAASADTDPAATQVIDTWDMGVSAEMMMSSEYFAACQAEIGYVMHMIAMEYGSGYYWFRVQAMPDTDANSPSAWAYSPVWANNGPEYKLEVSNVHWDENKGMRWDNMDYSIVRRMQVQVAYSRSEDEQPDWNNYITGFNQYNNDDWEQLKSSMLRGDGYYWFRVRAISKNPNTYADSDWAYSPALYFTSPTTPMPAVTDLQWHVFYEGGMTAEMPGSIGFRGPAGAGFHISLWRYYDQFTGATCLSSFNGELSVEGEYSTREFADLITESGSYFVSVGLLGDDVNYVDGPMTESAMWEYQRPAKVLNALQPTWDVANGCLDWEMEKTLVDRVQLQFYYNPYEDNRDGANMLTSYDVSIYGGFDEIPSYLFNNGEGWYYYDVRLLPADITQAVAGDWTRSPGYQFVRAPMPSATDLRWDVELTQNGFVSKPSNIFFRCPEDALYDMSVYKRVGDSWVDIGGWGGRAWDEEYVNAPYFCDNPNMAQTGEYYFTVVIEGENGMADSAVATSEVWSYTRPETELKATNLQWNIEKNLLTWEIDKALVDGLTVDFWFNPTEDNAQNAWQFNSYGHNDGDPMEIPAYIFNQQGPGWYYFSIRTNSNDISKAIGVESAMSAGFRFTGADRELNLNNPVWTGDGFGIGWTHAAEGDANLTEYYDVKFYYSPTPLEDPSKGEQIGRRNYWGYDELVMPDKLLCGDGYYYFTARALSNNVLQAADSEWSAFSAPLHYVAPTLKLNIDAVGWDGTKPIWVNDFDASAPVKYYEVRYYFGETENDIDINEYMDWYTYEPEYLPESLPTWMVQELGEGYYAFTVRAVSADPLTALTGDWSAMSPVYHFTGASEKAPQVTDIQWHLDRHYADEETITKTGVVSFRGTVPEKVESQEYRVSFYRRGTEGREDELVGQMWTSLWQYEAEYATVNPFKNLADQMTSGTYYCTVTSVGDGINYADSEPVRSPDWTYTRPEVQLQVSNPVWNSDMTMSWTEGAGQADQYRFQYQFVEPGEQFEEDGRNGSATMSAGEKRYLPSMDMLQNYGSGTWYFRLMAMPADVTEAASSEWSEWSPGFAFTAHNNTLDARNLAWNQETMEMTWDLDEEDLAAADYFQVRVYYGRYEDGYDYRIGSYAFLPEDAPFILPAEAIAEEGAGYYWFQVRGYSKDYTKAFDSYGWSDMVSKPLLVKGPETPAAKALDLQWNISRSSTSGNVTEKPGNMSFENPCYDGSTRTEFHIMVFRKGADGDSYVGETHTRSRNRYININPFNQFPELMTSGTYYFTVVTVGDRVNTCDSPEAVSPEWAYIRPNKQLEVSNPWWKSDMTPGWNIGDIEADYYDIQFQYVEKGDQLDPDDWNDSSTWWPEDEIAPKVPDYMIDNYGSGTYHFRVRAMSENINNIISSDWTAWSEGFDYKKPNVRLNPKNITWDETTYEMNWTVDMPECVDYYEVALLYGETADQMESYEWFWVDTNELPWSFPQWVWEDYGTGYYSFIVYAYTNDPTKALFGEAEYDGVLYHKAADQPLGTPTDLQWHKEVDYDWVNGQRVEKLVDRMGNIAFKRPVDANGKVLDQARYDLEIWRVGETEPADTNHWTFSSTSENVYFDMTTFIYEDLPSGDYYFRVRAEGDGINYVDGEWASSGVWHYEKPAAQLSAPTGLGWNDTDYTNWEGIMIAATWTPVADAAYYDVDFFFAKDEKSTPKRIGGTFDIRNGEEVHTNLRKDQIAENGEGLYFFQVRAIPADITKISSGAWSVMSPAYDTREKAEDVNDKLDDLLHGTVDGVPVTPSAEIIQDTLTEIGILDEMMAADAAKGETGTLDKLAELEEIVKDQLNVETKVEVNENLANRFEGDVPEIKASNMAINVDLEEAAAAQKTEVKLTVSAAGDVQLPAQLIDTQKDNTMVFSMDLENAKDADDDASNGRQLLVPVQITLPIPRDINRSFLVVLHQKSNGTWEELFLPHVFEKNGQWFATFSVTSFSNYAIGEKKITAEAEGNVVTVEAHLPTCGTETTYMCAVYSADGQMLGMGMLKPWAEEALEIELKQDVPADAYVRIFAPDTGADWAAPSEAIEVKIK